MLVGVETNLLAEASDVLSHVVEVTDFIPITGSLFDDDIVARPQRTNRVGNGESK